MELIGMLGGWGYGGNSLTGLGTDIYCSITSKSSNSSRSQVLPRSSNPLNSPTLPKSSNSLADNLQILKQHYSVDWPAQAEDEAVKLFSTTDGDAQMNKELAIFYCVYSDFKMQAESPEGFDEGARNNDFNLYLVNHPNQKKILVDVFCCTPTKRLDTEKLYSYMQICMDRGDYADSGWHLNDNQLDMSKPAQQYYSLYSALSTLGQALS